MFLLSTVTTVPAQSKDSSAGKRDTANQGLLAGYNSKLEELEQQRLTDSVKRAQLETQINSLKTTDNLKKQELQARLDELNSKEANRLLQKKQQIDSLRKTAKGEPVIAFFNDTLFSIYSGIGSFSAKERADATSERIRNLANDYTFSTDSLNIQEIENTLGICYRDRTISSISENDALWDNTSKDSLAQMRLNIIRKAIRDYRDKTSFQTLAKEIGLALLCILVMALLIYVIVKFFRWLAAQIRSQEGKKLKGIRIRNYTLFDSQKQLSSFLMLNNFVKWVVILTAVYIALPILFGIFPSTEDLAGTLIGYILNPLKAIVRKVWNYLPNLVTIIVIYIIFRYVLKVLRFLKVEIATGKLRIPGFFPDWANPTFQIIRILTYAFMLIVIFPYLPGSDSPVFKGVSVFLGFLFTFGSAGSLSNVISGLVLTYMRLFKIGDRVKIGDVFGDVIEKSMLVTRVRTIKNEIISIPNSTVMSSHTINYSSDAPLKGLILHTTVTIGYDVPWKDMHQALIDAALRTEHVLHEPLPFVLQTGLEDFYVSYQINAYVRESNKQATIYSNLYQNIQDVCNERGIEIMSPHYRAGRDGNQTTIPEQYWKKENDVK
ncbi:mechanosensitive ion channel [Taibaiella lutea]|uniref:Mechanosensitive ion channel n=2 Tax=Taibaiella lutea TaxID=2608001 RepID=A0A5M6CC60_9BACT|nr:mechanosensitive ion channel [Taibaiella lutea]